MEISKWNVLAYKQGWDAGFADNWQDYTNPYIPDTLDYKMWSKGFRDGLSNWDMSMDDGG